MFSFAQNAEDIVLWRAFKDTGVGFYVDVGAHHPVGGNVTKILSDHGWRGINIEPQPALWELLRDARPRDVNLNVGVADVAGAMPFWAVIDDSERSTFNRELGEGYQREGRRVSVTDIPVRRLDDILEHHAPPTQRIDLLKIDAEGFEEQVLRGANLARWKPSVVLAEHNFFPKWEPLLLDHGYRLTLYDGLNRFYVHRTHEALAPALSLPPLRTMDGFELWLHAQQLEQARRRIAELEQRIAQIDREDWRKRQPSSAVREMVERAARRNAPGRRH